MASSWQNTVDFIRGIYKTKDFIPLHEPRFRGNEKKYLGECIDSTFVSSVGEFVTRFENICAEYTGVRHAVATVNGTAALHMALKLSGVEAGDEVLTQPLTFVATANAIDYLGAHPVFIDVDRDTLGLSPDKLEEFLEEYAEVADGVCRNKQTGRTIRSCVPMHTFGHPCRIDRIKQICDRFQISLIEDAAESLGSLHQGQHTGSFGKMGILSFNGNKTITCGGGGMILTNDKDLADLAKHLTTTGKVPHRWEYCHDAVAFNYRLTNLSAALGCAQMEQLESILASKREISEQYREFFRDQEIEFVWEPAGARSNFWLNAIVLESRAERDEFLEFTNDRGIMTRPVWRLMNHLPGFKDCLTGDLGNSAYLEERLVNLPSSCR